MTIKPIAKDFKLVIEREALTKIFTRVDRLSDRRRIRQRLHHINKLALPLGVSLSIDGFSIYIYAPSHDAIRALAHGLREQGGLVQRLFADWLVDNLSLAADQTSPFMRIREAQLNFLRGRLSRDLGVLAGLDIDKVLLEPARGTTPRTGLPARAIGTLARSGSRGLIVIGEVGGGKTTLLYQVLRDFDRFAGPLGGLFPLYVPATRLSFKWGDGDVPWTAIPGVDVSLAATVERLFTDGRLLLLIDGVNENPLCVDFPNPGVQYFWDRAARNAFMLTTLARDYEARIRFSPLESSGRLPQFMIPQWRLDDYERYFVNLICLADDSTDPYLANRLKRFPVAQWVAGASLLKQTPLVGCAAANFVANSPEARYARNEYEMMEQLVLCSLTHKGFQGSISQREQMLGALMKIAVQAYQEGQSGERWCVSLGKAVEIARAHYGVAAEASIDIKLALANLPFVDINAESDLLFLDQHVGDFLVGRFMLNALLMRDYSRFHALIAYSVRYDRVGKYFFQGFEVPPKEARKQILRNTEEFFNHLWEKYEQEPTFQRSLELGVLLQPLGYLGIPEAVDFLWSAFKKAEGPNFVFFSATIALARGGQRKAEEDYVAWLKRNKSGRDFILQFRLFYERNDRERRDFESFHPARVPNWDDACDWLLRVIAEDNKDFYPLRHLYVYTLLEFIRRMGVKPFVASPYGNGSSEMAAQRRRQALQRVLSSLSARSASMEPAFVQDVKDLQKEAARVVGGKARREKDIDEDAQAQETAA